MAAAGPLILDFDGSVLPLPGEGRLRLADWQERLRYGCTPATLDRLESLLPPAQAAGSTTFLGSGDYHHVSERLIHRQAAACPGLQVVVFDNHPDNMRYPFGIHCGSWVWHVGRLPAVACVHVVGIASTDVEAAHAWENRLGVLRSGRVRYWCIGRKLDWTGLLGIRGCTSWPSATAMLAAFAAHIDGTDGPIYLSIDKDVLAPGEVRTNWDQGVMTLAQLEAAVGHLRPRVVGSDITGEVSAYRYRGWLKRLLSRLDGQSAPADDQLLQWQEAHRAVNLRLLRCLQS